MPTNTPSSPAPYPMGSQEQQATIRRRALPIGISGACIGIIALTALLLTNVRTEHPPSIYAVNLSFCAMMMGIGIIFYARHTTGTRTAVAASIIALATGFAGPLIYTKQSLDFKSATESGELANVTAIQSAARQYALTHDGNYPPDLATLLEQKLITPQTLHSPYEISNIPWPTQWKSHEELEKFLADHSDFQYFGQDLKLPADTQPTAATNPDDAFSLIVLVSKRYPIERKEISICFADGRTLFVGGEDWESVWTKSNNARRSLGFPEVHPPSLINESEKPPSTNPQ